MGEKTLTIPPTAEVRKLIEDRADQPVYKMTIHDVKYDKGGGTMLLDRSGQPFPRGRIADSAYEFILRRTLEQAKESQKCDSGYSVRPSPAPDERVDKPWRTNSSAVQKKYRLQIAQQPMMPA